jgi:putative tryptophan/tyrosine transport system substrate-binding protein
MVLSLGEGNAATRFHHRDCRISGRVAAPARAQQPDRMQRIGVLMGYAESNVEGQAFVAAFREELLKLGWVEGRNLRSDYRWVPPGDAETTRRFAKELVALQPNLILAHNTPTTAAALEQTHTIPIVFAIVADPVGSGFVTSFSRPGGNATGFTTLEPTMAGKWLDLLKEIAPRVNRAALLFNPATMPSIENFLSSFNAAAASLAVGRLPHLFVTRPLSKRSWLRRRASRMAASS